MAANGRGSLLFVDDETAQKYQDEFGGVEGYTLSSQSGKCTGQMNNGSKYNAEAAQNFKSVT